MAQLLYVNDVTGEMNQMSFGGYHKAMGFTLGYSLCQANLSLVCPFNIPDTATWLLIVPQVCGRGVMVFRTKRLGGERGDQVR